MDGDQDRRDIFISHVKDDSQVAIELAYLLEKNGFSTWIYEIDVLPGLDYLTQEQRAIENCQVAIVLISEPALNSVEVDAEIHDAYRCDRKFMPLLIGLEYSDVHQRRRQWATSFRAAASMAVQPGGIDRSIQRIIAGLKLLSLVPITNELNQRIEELNQLFKHIESSAGKEPSKGFSPAENEPSQPHLGQQTLVGRADAAIPPSEPLSQEKQEQTDLPENLQTVIDELQKAGKLYRERKIKITIFEPGKPIRTLALDGIEKKRTLIGRAMACDIILEDDMVSRLHATIIFSSHLGWIIQDHNSTNHTYVRGKRINLTSLRPASQVKIGDTMMIIASSQDDSADPSAK